MFNQENYPKSYASIGKNDYRLKEFFDRSEAELESIEHKLWEFVNKKIKRWDVVTEYSGLEYIDSGWEMSVFRFNNEKVVKVSNGMFGEVSSKKYFENIENAYSEITKILPENFFLPIEIDISNLKIYQDFIDANYFYCNKNEKLSGFVAEQINEIIHCMIESYKKFYWSPFKFQLSKDSDFYVSYNILKGSNDKLIVTDFTDYYDIFKLYPQRTKTEIEKYFEVCKQMIRDLDLDTKLISELSLANLKIQSELDQFIQQKKIS